MDRPVENALLLNDALETGRLGDIADALSRIRNGNAATIRSIAQGGGMHLAELMDILQSAGLRLVAVPDLAAAETGQTLRRENG